MQSCPQTRDPHADGGGGHAFSLQSDEAIFAGFRAGRPGAAEELWRVFAPRMFAVARGLLGPRRQHMASDIVQRVLLDVLRLPDARLQDVRDIGAFLAVSTRNATFNAMRGENRELLRLREASRRARDEHAHDEPANKSPDQLALLAAAIEMLPEEHRDILVLRHIAGLSFDQLTIALGEARSTLASRHARALHLLRERLESQPAHPVNNQLSRPKSLSSPAPRPGPAPAVPLKSHTVGGDQ